MTVAQAAPPAGFPMIFGLIVIAIVIVAAIVLVTILRRMLGGVHKPRSFTAVTEVTLSGADHGEVWKALADVENESSRPQGTSFRWLDEGRTLYRFEDSGGNGITWLIIEEQAPTRSVRQYELDAMPMRGIVEVDLSRSGSGVNLTITHHCDIPGIIAMMLKRRPNAEHSMAGDLVGDIVRRLGHEETPEIRPVDIAESPEPLVEPLDLDPELFGAEAQTESRTEPERA
ncbi:MAG: hypothetical protein JJU33_01330 [Phycisphaerales bacterium]|nr:hypothetical protein [Phycisphaerales bacterium]